MYKFISFLLATNRQGDFLHVNSIDNTSIQINTVLIKSSMIICTHKGLERYHRNRKIVSCMSCKNTFH